MGDKEKALGMSVSPLCDRERTRTLLGSQIGFFKFVCLPFYKPVFDLVNPEMAPAVNCRDNFWRWLNQKDAREDRPMGEPVAAALGAGAYYGGSAAFKTAGVRRRLDHEFDAAPLGRPAAAAHRPRFLGPCVYISE